MVFDRLKESCREVIVKYGTDDDFTALKTSKGAVLFEGSEIIPDLFTEHLKNAKDIHDKWEEIYISKMDFERQLYRRLSRGGGTAGCARRILRDGTPSLSERV